MAKKSNDVTNKNVRQYEGQDQAFRSACEKAKVPATHRQHRKWKDNRGAAYQAR